MDRGRRGSWERKAEVLGWPGGTGVIGKAQGTLKKRLRAVLCFKLHFRKTAVEAAGRLR